MAHNDKVLEAGEEDEARATPPAVHLVPPGALL